MTTYNSVFGNEAIPQSDSSFVAVSLTADTQFFWPELNSGPNLTADIMEVSSTGAFSIIFPPANQVSVGKEVLVRNLSAFLITLKDYANGAIGTLAPSEAKFVYIKDNTTAAGLWSILNFGIGVSSPDASALAGHGLRAQTTTLNQESEVFGSSSSSTISISSLASTVVYSASGAVTCSLLDAAIASNGFFFNLSNQGSGQVTIEPFASQTVDGELNKIIAPGESATLVCSGSAWITVGYGRSTQFQFTKLVYDISAGTPFTLTSVQAQNKLIEFIGTLTAPVVVNLPAVVAVYYTQCSYSGAFNVTVKTAAGIGIDLQPGERSILYCDGFNVVMAQTATSPTVNLDGGAAGAIPYQAAEDITAFSSAGNVGDLFRSGGTGAPTWMDPNQFLTLKTSPTGSTQLASGTTAERDVAPVFGQLRANADLGALEYYSGTGWSGINGSAVMNEESFTATEGQTVFTTAGPHEVGIDALSIFINGLEQASTAYTETSRFIVTFNEGLSAGDHVEMRWGTAEYLSEADASNVSYQPAGSGAVLRPAQDKMRESVSVKDFGAVGDGVTDDTAAIQAALDATSHYGLLFPAGRYAVTSITIPNSRFIWFDGATILGLGISAEDAVVKLEGSSCQIYNLAINPNYSDNYTCALWWNNNINGSQFTTIFGLTINNARRGIVYGELPGNPATVPPMSENSLVGYCCYGVQNPWYGNAANGVTFIESAKFVALDNSWPVGSAFDWINARAIENYSGLLFINNSEIVKSANSSGYTADLNNVNFSSCYFEFAAPVKIVGNKNRFANCRFYQLVANQPTFYYPPNVATSEQYFTNCGFERPSGAGLSSTTPFIDMSAITVINAATNDITLDNCSLVDFNWQTAYGYVPLISNAGNLKFCNTRYWRNDSATDKYLLNNRSSNLLVEAGKDYLGYTTATWYPENGSGIAAVTIAVDGPAGFNSSSIQLAVAGGTGRAMTIDTTSVATIQATGFQVKPGDLFVLSLWLKMPTGAASGGGIRAVFYDNGGSLVVNDEIIDYSCLSGSSWAHIYARISVPINACFMGIAGQTNSNTVRFTQVQLFRANN